MHQRGEEGVQGFDAKARKKRDHLQDEGIDGRMGIRWILGILPARLQSGYSWLRIESGGRLV
jgi:hypothetical protein